MKLRFIDYEKPKTVIILWFGVTLVVVSLYILLNQNEDVKCVTESLKSGENHYSVANLPLGLYDRCTLDAPKLFIGKKCTKYPTLDQIDFDNLYWQRAVINWVEIYLFGAYYDKRASGGAVVKILGVSEDVKSINSNIICQIWFKNHGAVVESNYIEDFTWIESYRILIVTCEVPEIFDDRIPHSVSIANYECAKSTNVLQITTDFEESNKNKIAICTTSLFMEISPRDLIEWIEFIRSLGVEQIYIYYLSQDDNSPIKSIINYYNQQGVLDMIHMTLPGKFPNFPDLQREILQGYSPWNILPGYDCFYSHNQEFRHVFFMDLKQISLVSIEIDWSTWWHQTIKTLLNPHELQGIYGNNTRNFLEFKKEELATLLGRINDVLSRLNIE